MEWRYYYLALQIIKEWKYHSPYFLKHAPLTVTCRHLRVRLVAQQQAMSHLPTHRMLKQNPWEVDLLTSWSGRLSNPTWPERDKFRSSSFWNVRGETFENPWQHPLGTPPSPVLSSWHMGKRRPLCAHSLPGFYTTEATNSRAILFPQNHSDSQSTPSPSQAAQVCLQMPQFRGNTPPRGGWYQHALSEPQNSNPLTASSTQENFSTQREKIKDSLPDTGRSFQKLTVEDAFP